MDEKALNETQLIAVAALMHDIGKFMQRAVTETKQTFAHPELSEAFFSEQKQVFYKEDEKFLEDLRFLVSHHHERDLDESGKSGKLRILAEILSEADNISSGEREKDTKITLGLLTPILARVNLGKQEPKNSRDYFFSLSPLSFDNPTDFLYPVSGSESANTNIESMYMKHWKAFLEEYRELVQANGNKLVPDSLFYLLQKYCWCIPSAYYQTQPDISLFEHSKITAALATSLYRFFSDLGSEIFNSVDPQQARQHIKNRDEKRFLFVVVDINGIQDFIYSISHRKGLRSLKGRSFYIEMLSEVILRYIIWDPEINLFENNIVFSGGGKGYLILPISCKERLEELKEEIEQWLFDKFEGRLMASFGILEASADDFSKEKIGGSWRKVLDLASRDRQHKFQKLITEHYDEFFEPREEGGYFNVDGKGDERVICGICRIETNKTRATEISEEDETYYICEECKRFIELGKSLKDAKYIVFAEGEFKTHLDTIGNKRKLFFGLTEKPVATNGRTLVLNLANESIPQKGFSNSVAFGFYLYGGRNVPIAKTLEDLVAISSGVERLGILKMDVDNLRLILSQGLKERTLSRISQLSSSISLFFRGEINNIIARHQRFKESIYVIYAGGDDLFTVGSWDAIPEFATEVRERFARYVCNNNSLTISAGIHLIKKGYPLYRGALYASQAEENAKAYENKDKKKDAINFLGVAVSWNDLKVSRAIKDMVVESYEKTDTKSVLRQLQAIDSLYQKQKKSLSNKKTLSPQEILTRARWSRWMWFIAYMIGRTTSKDAKQKLENLKNSLITDEVEIDGQILRSDKQIIEFLTLPVTWADYQTRNKEGKHASSN